MSLKTDSSVSYSSNISKKGQLNKPVVVDHPNYKGFIASWGKNNKFPQELVAKVKASSLLRPMLEKKADIIFSGGMVYGYMEQKGEDYFFKRVVIDEAERDLARTGINLFLNECARDWYTFNNAFPQGVLSVDRKKIVQIYNQDTSFCRLTIQEARSRKIEACVVNANWQKGNTNFIDVLPVLDPYYDQMGQIQSKSIQDEGSFILPLRSMTYGSIYYDDPEYLGIFESGWYDIHMEIPKLKKALMEKMINVAMHVKVNYEWWEWKYPGFKNKSVAEKKALIKEESNNFMDSITDSSKRVQILMTGFGMNPMSGKENHGWIVEPIKFDNGNSEELEYSQESDLHLMRALKLHSSLIGIASKNGLGAGSGSDMEKAYDQFLLMTKAAADRILMLPQLMIDYNDYTSKAKSLTKGNRLICLPERYFTAVLDKGTAPIPTATKNKSKNNAAANNN